MKLIQCLAYLLAIQGIRPGLGLPLDDPDPSVDICRSEGFFRYPNNCKRFYRCVKWSYDSVEYSIFHFTCPSGTVFDESVQVSLDNGKILGIE